MREGARGARHQASLNRESRYDVISHRESRIASSERTLSGGYGGKDKLAIREGFKHYYTSMNLVGLRYTALSSPQCHDA